MRDAKKRFCIEKAPQILTLHLKRFEQHGLQVTKVCVMCAHWVCARARVCFYWSFFCVLTRTKASRTRQFNTHALPSRAINRTL